MIVALVVAAVLALLAVGVVAADRSAAMTAERRAGVVLSGPFGHPATVRVHGAPFLPQALRGRYADVEVTGTVRVGEISGAALTGQLRNVRIPLRDLLGRRVREVPCEHLGGRLVLPYGELARVSRIPGLVLHFEGERLLATAALPVPEIPGLAAMMPGLTGLGGLGAGLGAVVPGIGQLARVSGEAVLTLRGSSEVWLELRHVAVAGIAVPGAVLKQLLPSLIVPIPLPALPFGLRLDELRPTSTGLVVDGSADAVVLRTTVPPP